MATTPGGDGSSWSASLRAGLTRHRRRRQLYVEPLSQVALIRQFMLMIAFGAAAGVGTMSLLESLAEIYVWYAHAGGAEAWVTRGAVFVYQLVFVLIAAAIAFVLALGFSHRIGGPLRLIDQALGRISDGDLRGSVRLRDDDLLHHVADSVNASASGLADSVRAVETALRDVRERHDGGEDIASALADLEAAVARFETGPRE